MLTAAALSWICLRWDPEGSSDGLMLWSIWGFFTSFTAGRGTWQRHHCSPSYQNLPKAALGWVIGVLMHRLPVACSWNIWVLRHKLHGLIGCSCIKHIPQLRGCSCMKCWSAQAWPDRTFKHALIRHLCATNWVLMHVPAGEHAQTNRAHALINCALMNKLLAACAQTDWALVCVLIEHSCTNCWSIPV